MPHPQDEVAATAASYRSLRQGHGRGEQPWTALADLFTDDAVYIDPAWGRIEGHDEIRTFMEESMTGLEDWTFPVEFIAIEGDDVVVKWTQVLPGTRPDGGQWTQSGYSTLVYAGDGRFSYEEDLLNMTHVHRGHRRQRLDPRPRLHPAAGDPRPGRVPPRP